VISGLVEGMSIGPPRAGQRREEHIVKLLIDPGMACGQYSTHPSEALLSPVIEYDEILSGGEFTFGDVLTWTAIDPGRGSSRRVSPDRAPSGTATPSSPPCATRHSAHDLWPGVIPIHVRTLFSCDRLATLTDQRGRVGLLPPPHSPSEYTGSSSGSLGRTCVPSGQLASTDGEY
jgi:hypothetical protein